MHVIGSFMLQDSTNGWNWLNIFWQSLTCLKLKSLTKPNGHSFMKIYQKRITSKSTFFIRDPQPIQGELQVLTFSFCSLVFLSVTVNRQWSCMFEASLPMSSVTYIDVAINNCLELHYADHPIASCLSTTFGLKFGNELVIKIRIRWGSIYYKQLVGKKLRNLKVGTA